MILGLLTMQFHIITIPVNDVSFPRSRALKTKHLIYFSLCGILNLNLSEITKEERED